MAIGRTALSDRAATEDSDFRALIQRIRAHENRMRSSLNLIASENVLSPTVSRILASDLGNRVAEGPRRARYFPALEDYDALEQYGVDLLCHMFSAKYADPRPISGTMANMIVYAAVTKPGDTIASISIANGAHVSMAGPMPRRVFGLELLELPFDQEAMTIHAATAVDLIVERRPRLVVLGGSVLLFPQPVGELAEATHSVGGVVLFDAAHVAGLVAAGMFPNPLRMGADVMTITTCKTIPGPQHAFILTGPELAEHIDRLSAPTFLSGHHLHETVAAFVALEEFRHFGREYSEAVVRNARRLAAGLAQRGLRVLGSARGFTSTHMLVVDLGGVVLGAATEALLERSGVVVNRNMIAGDRGMRAPAGIRIGTQEVTRLGMGVSEMDEIAEVIADALSGRSTPDESLQRSRALRTRFAGPRYCFPFIDSLE